MQPEAILAAAAGGSLPEVEEVDPTTARLEGQYLVVSGRVAMPLDGVAWSLDRENDILILDDLGATLGVLCLTAGRAPKQPAEMTRYQYTALLADAPDASAVLGPARISRDYAVIDEAELARYIEHYLDGSALWGGFHHGDAPADPTGAVTEIKARRGIVAPTPHHLRSLLLLTRATNPREQFLRTYHLIELLFDYVTYRRFVKAGNDLVGFGRIMSAYQRSEFERLKSIIRDFCRDLDAVAARMAGIEPFIARAEDMFQTQGKEGNPLKEERRWTAFRSLVEAGTVDRAQAVSSGLASGNAQFDETISALAAYQIYRIRSSIAHSRIGEYLLTDEDDAMISEFGLPLLADVAGQVFSSATLAELVA